MSFIPKYTISEKIRSDLREIETLRDKIRGNRILPEAEASIRLRASVESIHSSTSIEGNPLNAEEVRVIVKTDRPLSRQKYAEIEVQNYKKALDYIDQRRHGNSNITIEDILELHRLITDGLLDKTRNGKIRKRPVYIENQDGDVLYTAADANIVKEELEGLLEWVQKHQFSVSPVVLAAVIHFSVVTIHPFADGNGRTARALTSLFLALNRYDCNGALVLDSFYASDRKAYYAILHLVQGENYAHSLKADLTPWIEYFTDGFLTSMHVLDAEIRMVNLAVPARRKMVRLDPEEQDIMSYVNKFGSVSISEVEDILPEVSRRSAQRKLRELVDRGLLEMVGETWETRYVLKGRRR